MQEVVIVSGVRTAIGGFGGTLRSVPPTELAKHIMQEVMNAANIRSDWVGLKKVSIRPSSSQSPRFHTVCFARSGDRKL